MKARKYKWMPFAVAGGLTGLVNGFFGGGGGMVLVPLLRDKCGVKKRNAYATSVAIILPLCMMSVGIYLLRGELSFGTAVPYMTGGLVGGLFGGKLFKKVSVTWIRRVFALLILYGAWRSFV